MEQQEDPREKELRRANLRLAWALGLVALGVMLLTIYNLRLNL